MDYRALSDSLCGSARSWTKLFTTWHELLLGHRHFRAFPRALSFPSGSSFYNALQFSSGFFFSDVLDQSHFSG
jgi:hypothetical protein